MCRTSEGPFNQLVSDISFPIAIICIENCYGKYKHRPEPLFRNHHYNDYDIVNISLTRNNWVHFVDFKRGIYFIRLLWCKYYYTICKYICLFNNRLINGIPYLNMKQTVWNRFIKIIQFPLFATFFLNYSKRNHIIINISHSAFFPATVLFY